MRMQGKKRGRPSKGVEVNKSDFDKISSYNIPRKSIHETRTSYDNGKDQPNVYPEYFKTIKEGSLKVADRRNIIFRRGMSTKEVKLELFMIEGIDGFFEKKLRSQMQIVVDRSSKDLREVFFEEGLENKLPKTWEEFKNYIVEFCNEQGIETIEKYRDEPWSKYIQRLMEWAKSKNQPGEKILKKLRTQWLPSDLKIIFLSSEMTIETALERVREWEEFVRQRNFREKIKTKPAFKKISTKGGTKDLSKIQCFKCKSYGHYSTSCTQKDKINTVYNENKSGKIDINKIKINNVETNVIFDTGACNSIIPKKFLKNLKNYEIIKCSEVFIGLNGTKVTVNRKVRLEIEFEDKKIKEMFYIVERGDDILISNEIVKIFKEKKEMPVVCRINTQDKGPVSWTRPIRSHSERVKFKKICEDLEKRNIIEPSKSEWLNPVVLTRKKK